MRAYSLVLGIVLAILSLFSLTVESRSHGSYFNENSVESIDEETGQPLVSQEFVQEALQQLVKLMQKHYSDSPLGVVVNMLAMYANNQHHQQQQ